jgi:hypothetical protein
MRAVLLSQGTEQIVSNRPGGLADASRSVGSRAIEAAAPLPLLDAAAPAPIRP